MILRRLIIEFQFFSYVWMSLTCSRSFPRGVARGCLHLFFYLFFVFFFLFFHLFFCLSCKCPPYWASLPFETMGSLWTTSTRACRTHRPMSRPWKRRWRTSIKDCKLRPTGRPWVSCTHSLRKFFFFFLFFGWLYFQENFIWKTSILKTRTALEMTHFNASFFCMPPPPG